MNDKEIRQILISFLQAEFPEGRIYQEKNIGTAICDVMMVSDELTGFEIKSDCDTLARLSGQVAAYNLCFEKNYLVVSQKFFQIAPQHIPDHWGLLYIDGEKVFVARPARKNKTVSLRRQLDLLWKLELKNLLMKNHLPLFAQKSKAYIVQQLIMAVDAASLKKQIAAELKTRDYSAFTDGISTSFTSIPADEIVDSLSEENLETITLDAWMDLYRKAKERRKEKEQLWRKKEMPRAPHAIHFNEIEVSLGAPWVSQSLINDFANYLAFDTEEADRQLIEYEPVTGAWFVKNKRQIGGSTVAARFSTPRYSALQILEATLNLRDIKIYDACGKLDEGETLAALQKQELLCSAFKEWVGQDGDRVWAIEEAYNRLFAQFVPQPFDGSALTFPTMNPDFSLYDYQKDAVQRIISTKNTLLAFDVGAGKTFVMIAAAMEMRRMGLSRKNLFVVPNNITGQWEQIFLSLYPAARVLSIEPKTFTPDIRQKVLKQIRDGDYDGIIMAYSCFELIPLSADYLTNSLSETLSEIQQEIDRLGRKGGSPCKSALHREIESIKKLSADLILRAERHPNQITFDALEINTLFLDEAHNYKNIPIKTKLKHLRGINTKGSASCAEMLRKVRCVQEQNGGRGAIFATGTPLCNSISDAYNMQRYLQYDDLHQRQLDRFDNWVKTFARAEQHCEVDVTAKNFRFVRRFTRFFNLAELSKMFSAIACFHETKQDHMLPQNVAFSNIVVPENQSLSAYMKHLAQRAEEIRSGKINPKYDNMLKVSTDGRKAALDLSLVGKQAEDSVSKLTLCAREVLSVYKQHPSCAQLVFCDYATPKPNEVSIYQKLKQQLINGGIRPEEIAFIHSYNTESRRLQLYENINRGVIRVLIGSTFKLGIGANVQQKLKAIHHLDVPWRPADMTQREGRILRRGNENNDVCIYRYIARGSFDAYSWQILENKQRFISQFLSGNPDQKSITDLENNVLSYAEVKMIALGKPMIEQIAEKENEIKILETLCRKSTEEAGQLADKIKEKEAELEAQTTRYNNSVKNLVYLGRLSNDLFLREMKAARLFLTKDIILNSNPVRRLFSFLGFAVFPRKIKDKPAIALSRNAIEYLIPMGENPEENSRQIASFLKGFKKIVASEREGCVSLKRSIEEMTALLALPKENYQKLAQRQQELLDLKALQESESHDCRRSESEI